LGHTAGALNGSVPWCGTPAFTERLDGDEFAVLICRVANDE